MMKKRRNKNIIMGFTFVVLAVLTLYTGISMMKEQKPYKKTNGEIVVVFKEELDNSKFEPWMKKYEPYAEVVNHIGNYALISVKENSDYKEVINSLAKEPMVLSAQENSSLSTLGFTDDPYSDTQWYIDNPGQYINISGNVKRKAASTDDVDMDVAAAWNYMAQSEVSDKEIVIAVIDTGIDYTHPDLIDHMWINEGEIPGDNIDNDNNGFVDDVYGWDFYNKDASICHFNEKGRASAKDNDNHGTHVAGIIAAAANNKIGIAGVASNINVKIMSLKINGGSNGEGNLSSAIEAIKYATMMGADICNLSWGTEVYLPGLEEIIKESNMLFIAAAGNTGDDNDRYPIYPASLALDNLISVTFVDANGMLTDLSNYGASTVDMAAPGGDVYSTVVGGYSTMSGSSMAAPQVTAVAAMLYAYKDHLYASNVKDIIASNLKEIDGLESYMIYGGIPNAFASVKAADSLLQDKDAPVMSLKTAFNKGEMTVSVNAKDIGTSDIRVIKWIYGTKKVQDFKKGMNGTTVKNGKVNLSKAGKYTFYATDYAGNEIAQVYEVKEDKTSPKIITTFSVASNYKSRTVTVIATDTQSGVKRVKYMAGIKKAEDFLPASAGKAVTITNGKGKFNVAKDGVYTVFASDNRGNIIVKPLIIKTIKATELKLSSNNRTIEIGDTYNLRAFLTPLTSTDKITFSSSNKEVAIVSSTGKITAKSQGTVYVTVKTASGLTSKCRVKVIPKKLE